MNKTRDSFTREAGFAISYYMLSLRTSLSRSYHGYIDNVVVGLMYFPLTLGQIFFYNIVLIAEG